MVEKAGQLCQNIGVMKKHSIFSTIALFFIFLSFISCFKTEELILSDGTFTGTGAGRNGPIQVLITVIDGKLTDAKITKEEETPDIGFPAEQEILDYFITSGGKTDIDAISGATISSNGITEALNAALEKSAGSIRVKTAYTDSSADIVIIGAGGAGLTAATEAASKGAHVIVLEKNGFVGGNSNSSTAGLNASQTSVQKKLGITDTNEQFFKDTMAGGHNKNDPELVKTLVESSAGIVEWLQSDIVKADLSDVGLMGGCTNRRTHRPIGGQAIGSHLVTKLNEAAKNAGAEIRLGNQVTDIIAENGIPRGVRVQNESGSYTIKAKAIIIATGGFGANSALIEKYRPDLRGFPTTNVKSAQGDAFRWVEKFNAQLTLMNEIQTHPTVVAGQGIMITEAIRGNGAIMIDHRGRRFINELETRDVVSQAVISLPEKTAYLLFNDEVRSSLKAVESYIQLFTTGSTIQELAEKLNMDPQILQDTIEAYDKAREEKAADSFGRKDHARALSAGSWYAIEVEPAIHHTMGGLKINSKAQVLNKSNNPIQNLYAAGEVTGGVHGDNRLGGNAVADICIFGKIAAESACTQLGY